MPRPPDSNAKHHQIIIQAKTVEEQNKIKALKEICARNNLHIRDEVFLLLDQWLLKHHWPATQGHSQFLMEEFFHGNRKSSSGCMICGGAPSVRAFIGKNSVLLCDVHLECQRGRLSGWKQLEKR